MHLIVDNHATDSLPTFRSCWPRHPRFVMHFTPTSASWLNMVQRFFREITDKHIRHHCFTNLAKLEPAIDLYVANQSIVPRLFIWTALASDILA